MSITTTETERASRESAYDNAHNEGGEGYNPHRNEITVPQPRSRESLLRESDTLRSVARGAWGVVLDDARARLAEIDAAVAEMGDDDE